MLSDLRAIGFLHADDMPPESSISPPGARMVPDVPWKHPVGYAVDEEAGAPGLLPPSVDEENGAVSELRTDWLSMSFALVEQVGRARKADPGRATAGRDTSELMDVSGAHDGIATSTIGARNVACLYGHRAMPCFRHIVLKYVCDTSNFSATLAMGQWKCAVMASLVSFSDLGRFFFMNTSWKVFGFAVTHLVCDLLIGSSN